MRLIVCGGRDFANAAFLNSVLDRIHAERTVSALMQGGASGADALASQWAKSKGIERYVCRAEWKRYGSSAGPIRNSRMLEWKPDLVVAFPSIVSVGTWDMVRQAMAAKVETMVAE